MNVETKNNLLDLLERNNISTDLFLEETYHCMLVSIFEALASEMADTSYERLVKERLRNSENKSLTIKNIVYEKTKCNISMEEAEYIYKLVYAYLTKRSTRKIFDVSVRTDLLDKQHSKCNICNKDISLNNSALDHIIPWALVGDELGIPNFQMLCEDCNSRKSKNVAYNLKMFLINKE